MSKLMRMWKSTEQQEANYCRIYLLNGNCKAQVIRTYSGHYYANYYEANHNSNGVEFNTIKEARQYCEDILLNLGYRFVKPEQECMI